MAKPQKGFSGSSEYEYYLRIKVENQKGMLIVLKNKYEPPLDFSVFTDEFPEAIAIDRELIMMLQKYNTNHPRFVSDLQDLLTDNRVP